MWECPFTGRADFFSWVVINTFIIFRGLFDIFWGRLLLLPFIITIWPIRKRGFGPFKVADMINPQWGLIQWIIYQIIIRIHFAVTLFQHSPLLTASSTRGSPPCTMKICINICTHVEDYLVLQGIFCSNTQFCKLDYRTPAWVYNVIGLHGSC